MTQQRIKGQETALSIMVDGELQTRIDTIQDLSIEFDLELLEEGYIGETANRYDSIFNGVSVEITLHITNQAVLELADAIVRRAQYREGGATRIDIAASFKFPNGDFPSILLPDVYFEAIPIEDGGRDEYVSVSLSGKTSGYEILT